MASLKKTPGAAYIKMDTESAVPTSVPAQSPSPFQSPSSLFNKEGIPETGAHELVERNKTPDSRSHGISHDIVFKTYRRRWLGMFQMFLLNLAVNWGWLLFAPVSDHAAKYYNTSKTGVNWLSISYQFSYCLCAPFTIKLLHLGPKPSFMAASALLLVGNWVRYASSHSRDGGTYPLVVVSQVLIGLAQPFILSAPTTYSDMWFTEKSRVVATAIATLSNPLGAALAQLITPMWVKEPGDISDAVLYVSIIATIASIPTFFIPAKPPTPVSHTSIVERPNLSDSLRHISSSVEIWLVLIPFATYVGLFNNISSLLNQILEPYGISEDDAGIGGAVLIVAGLVCSAITSPIFDRHKKFLPALRCAVPIIATMYTIFIWMPETRKLVGPYIVLGILGAASFSVIPVALEFLAELSYPVGSEVTSTLAWSLGQLLGACFIVISDALEAGDNADPPNHMKKSLIFQAVISIIVVPLPMCIGLFGRDTGNLLRRNRSNEIFHGQVTSDDFVPGRGSGSTQEGAV
ncbi:hypothetical protein Cpir12675_004447 [Ceratocystis pirilliformis]|uniref:Major facilitator superfamily domain-containing protein 7 n=1 Tax=Ceratocystis pirilliformis TaxID=259994 RepID=A0ABR3YXK4_9PEZI